MRFFVQAVAAVLIGFVSEVVERLGAEVMATLGVEKTRIINSGFL